jgi:hypothetical protein
MSMTFICPKCKAVIDSLEHKSCDTNHFIMNQKKQIEEDGWIDLKGRRMLEMLKKISIARRNGQEIPLFEIENLIKEVTEIK